MKLYDKVYYKILLLSENNLILSWLLLPQILPSPPTKFTFFLALIKKQTGN